MRFTRRYPILLICAVALGCTDALAPPSDPAPGQAGAIAIRLLDAQTGLPVSGAMVFIPLLPFSAATDAAGLVRLPPGTGPGMEVTARSIGYLLARTTIPVGGEETLVLRIEQAAVSVSSCYVSAVPEKQASR